MIGTPHKSIHPHIKVQFTHWHIRNVTHPSCHCFSQTYRTQRVNKCIFKGCVSVACRCQKLRSFYSDTSSPLQARTGDMISLLKRRLKTFLFHKAYSKRQLRLAPSYIAIGLGCRGISHVAPLSFLLLLLSFCLHSCPVISA